MHFIAPERYSALKSTYKMPSPKGVPLSIICLLQRDDFWITTPVANGDNIEHIIRWV